MGLRNLGKSTPYRFTIRSLADQATLLRNGVVTAGVAHASRRQMGINETSRSTAMRIVEQRANTASNIPSHSVAYVSDTSQDLAIG
jgi:hypothetical protein